MKILLKHYWALVPVFFFSCTGSKETSSEEIAAASAKANAYFDQVFDERVARQPQYQTDLGIKTDYDKWNNISDANAIEELAYTEEYLQYAVDSINPEYLDEQTQLSYKLFIADCEKRIASHKWRFHNYPVNQMFGTHTEVPSFLINKHLITDSAEAVAYISRLNGVAPLFDQLIENLKIREEKGIILPKFVFGRVVEDCKNIITGAPFDSSEPSAIMADFSKKVDDLPLSEEAKEQLKDEASAALLKSVKPSYEQLIAFLTDQEKRATTDDGAWKFPEGGSFFDHALAKTTTTALTAEEIHQIGLSEVERIHGEMKKIMKKVNFEGDLQTFFSHLRTESKFYYPNTEEGKQEYLDSATAIINNMRTQLDGLFITKPKAAFTVKRVEPFRENSAGKAFYSSPAPDGSRPGIYYVNLANTANVPKFEMEALAYHEGIPGHHMDRSIARELTGIPKFRKYGHFTAHIEGWGLYAEFIPKEMGMYADPYSDYGRLAMELWRACRLVVDTGIHLKKWTREDGIAYYQNNTSGTERECVRMVERHIVMPSQATAYKIGMMKILELRSNAQAKLGDKFDIREFHEVVLTNGALPLDVLSDLVDEWIASKA